MVIYNLEASCYFSYETSSLIFNECSFILKISFMFYLFLPQMLDKCSCLMPDTDTLKSIMASDVDNTQDLSTWCDSKLFE